jgi:hypothetical protein
MKPNQSRRPIEEMKQAEQNNEFVFKEVQTKQAEKKDEDGDESDNNYEDDESTKKNEDSISNLAKQLLKSKLEKPEPVTIKTAAVTNVVSKKNEDQDDLDLELDMDLENVDTTDVNLDDDISD